MALADGDLDNVYLLIGGVYHGLPIDAKHGDVGALEFLNETSPEWRELSSKPPSRPHRTG
jgi:hypothetical protein